MKKTLYCVIALMSLCLTFTSCGDDEIDRGVHAVGPEVASAGTYAGTMKVYEADLSATPKVWENTTLTMAAKEAYVSTATLNCPGDATATGDCTVNIVWSNEDFIFTSTMTNGTLGAGSSANVNINGNISAAGVVQMRFSKTVRSGRSTKTFHYVYEGVKQ